MINSPRSKRSSWLWTLQRPLAAFNLQFIISDPWYPAVLVHHGSPGQERGRSQERGDEFVFPVHQGGRDFEQLHHSLEEPFLELHSCLVPSLDSVTVLTGSYLGTSKLAPRLLSRKRRRLMAKVPRKPQRPQRKNIDRQPRKRKRIRMRRKRRSQALNENRRQRQWSRNRPAPRRPKSDLRSFDRECLRCANQITIIVHGPVLAEQRNVSAGFTLECAAGRGLRVLIHTCL